MSLIQIHPIGALAFMGLIGGLVACHDHGAADTTATDSEKTEEDQTADDSEDENADDVAEDEEEEEEEEVQDNPQSDCTYTDFSIANSGAGQIGENPDKPWFRYLAFSTTEPPGNMLALDSFQGAPYYGASEPGTYSLAGSNYEDCALCIVIWFQCDANYNCEKAFLADEGTLNIHSMAGVGSVFDATFDKVVLHEVTINPETYASTRVQNGETWCLDGYRIQGTTEQWE